MTMPTIRRLLFYTNVYTILVKKFGAKESDRNSFVHYFYESHDYHEWRFQGNLGSGGKFHLNNNKHYVSCYAEDMNPVRNKLIKEANEAIQELSSPKK